MLVVLVISISKSFNDAFLVIFVSCLLWLSVKGAVLVITGLDIGFKIGPRLSVMSSRSSETGILILPSTCNIAETSESIVEFKPLSGSELGVVLAVVTEC